MTDIHDIIDGESRAFEPGDSPPEQARLEPRLKTPTIAANDCSRWVGKDPPPLVFTINNLVPQGMVTLLIADGGAGKSMLMQTAMTCIPSGLPFLGKSTSGGATVGLFAEDPDAVLHLRQQRINKSLDVSMESLTGRSFPVSLFGMDAALWASEEPTTALGKIAEQLAGIDELRLLCIDNVLQVYAGNINDPVEVTRFMGVLNGLADRHDIGVLLSHHTSKTSDDSAVRAGSGTTAWVNAARAVLKLSPESLDGPPTLKVIKANHTKPGLTIELAWRDKVLCSTDNATDPEARRLEVEVLVLERCQRAWANGQPLTNTPQATARFLPKVLARGSDFRAREFEDVMNQLHDVGRLVIDQQSSKKPFGFRVS